MMSITINNKLNNFENNISHAPDKLSPYDKIKKITNKSIIVNNRNKKNIILKNIANRSISSDNIKKLYHLKKKDNKKDKAFFLGEGGNGTVYMVFKLNNEQITTKRQENKVSRTFINKKKCKHYILSVSKLGITKDFILNADDYIHFNESVKYAKEELKYNIIMGISAKLFIDYENMMIQLVSEYKGNILNYYIHYKPLNNNVSVSNGKILAKENLCYDLTRIIARQIINHILTFHNKTKCIHGDIKSSNILVNQLGEVTIIDFGAVMPMDSNNQIKVKNFLGTIVFLAPEMFGKSKYVNGKCIDIYCIGLTLLYIMLKQEIFFVDENNPYFDYQMYSNAIQEFKDKTDIPLDLKQIILGMVALNPKKRLSLEHALNIISPQRLSALNNLELEFEKQITIKKLVNLKKNNDKSYDNEALDIIDCTTNKSRLSYNREQKNLEKHLKKITKIISNKTAK